MLKWLWVSGVVIVLDQLTKLWAGSALSYAEPMPVIPFFNLTLLHNTGAAFSFLSTAGGWQRWFFALTAVVVSAILLAWLKRLKPGQMWLALALALVLGGALGNVIDRLYFGYVIDFLDFYYNNWHWPAFNVADMAISVGAVMLIIDSLRPERKPES
ncbi:MAG: signal peptidase II [Gammaproteobacteria bacterium]|nr:signal peptidase II [Gammaproteobacteria bacterium]MCW8993034.1 signal peptidase II [Gammaproteobacteria bacterium]